MSGFLTHTVPWSCRSRRPAETAALARAILLRSQTQREHRAASGSPEGESPPSDLASTSDLLKGTGMDLWPHRAAAPSPVSAQKQRLSLARAPSGALLLLPDVMAASVSYILLHTPKRGATGT